MVGMPKGTGNALFVAPNDDQPYFMREIVVPETAGMAPVTIDIDLHRGLWITGHVTDKDTNKPVDSPINYWPFLTNTHTSGLPEFGSGLRMQGDYFRYRSRPDGSFRIPGLPGRGLVGAEAMGGNYRQGAGASEIGDVDREGRLRTYRNQGWPSLKYPTTMKAINPVEGTENVVCDLVCDHGETVQITVLDPAGKPVQNCSTSAPTKNGKVRGVDSPFGTQQSFAQCRTAVVDRTEGSQARQVHQVHAERRVSPFADGATRAVRQPCLAGSWSMRREWHSTGSRSRQDFVAVETIRLAFPQSSAITTVVLNTRACRAASEVDFYAEGAAVDVIATFGMMSAAAGKTIELGRRHDQAAAVAPRICAMLSLSDFEFASRSPGACIPPRLRLPGSPGRRPPASSGGVCGDLERNSARSSRRTRRQRHTAAQGKVAEPTGPSQRLRDGLGGARGFGRVDGGS